MQSMDRDIDHILVTQAQLQQKVAELGAQISRDYAGRQLLLVSSQWACARSCTWI